MTICDSEAPSCDTDNRLVMGYSALSCCPEYRCGENGERKARAPEHLGGLAWQRPRGFVEGDYLRSKCSSPECDPAACPPVSALSCREDQFLVEVRGEKPCCFSYLCGMYVAEHEVRPQVGRWRSPWTVSPLRRSEINLCVFPACLSGQCVSHALSPFQRVCMERFWRWIFTTPTAAAPGTTAVSVSGACQGAFLRLQSHTP